MQHYKQLTYEQRYAIEVMLKNGVSKKHVSEGIGKSESTIHREVNRNRKLRGSYRAVYAQMLADERKKEGHYKRKLDDDMIRLIDNKLSKQWSPEQIKGYCDLNGVEMVSHERIYQYVWEDKRNGGVLYTHLRNSGKRYKKRYGSKDNRGQIPNRISIEQRPEVVNNKERVGDWEIDLIIGKNHKGAILTAVERKTGFLVMSKTDGKKAQSVKVKTVNALAPYKDIVHTITNDNGKEFALHQKVASKLDCDVYFAHPYASWERGLNEYTNKLIRQYLSKSMELDKVDARRINQIANRINARPRKKLGYQTPIKILNDNLNPKLALSG
jgi:IS30 family transposase